MIYRPTAAALLLILVLGGVSRAEADLIDLGDGTIYSTDLGIALLQDMNTAMTLGEDSDGTMSWFAAIAWIDHLNTVQHLGYSDWELASGIGAGTSQFPLRAQANYLEYVFYEELGNARPGPLANNVAPDDFNFGPFVNLGTSVAAGYWVFPELIDPSCVDDGVDCFAASYRIFEDHYDGDPWENYATAMRRTSVPEPATLLLFGSGLIGWSLLRRKPLDHEPSENAGRNGEDPNL